MPTSTIQPIPVTSHARVRMQQRVIPPAVVDYLIDFGDCCDAPAGAERYYFTRKSWRRLERYLGPAAKHFERWRNAYAIVADGRVVTAAWCH